MPVTFTPHEIKALEQHPSALRAAADYHFARESEADAIGEPETNRIAQGHGERAKELETEADRLQAEYEGA